MVANNQTNLFKAVKPKKQKVDEGLLNAIKFCVYPCNLEDKVILVPQDELETDDLSVRYLISTYSFKIQSVIPGTIEKKQHFEPNLKEVREVIVKGLKYKKLENGFTYEVLTDKDDDGYVSVLDIGSNQQPKMWLVEDLIKLLKNGKYTFLTK